MSELTVPEHIDWRQRQYISPYSADPIGLMLMKAGAPADADGDVTVTFFAQAATSTQVGDPIVADHPQTGSYEVVLPTAVSGVAGDYAAQFTYAVDGRDQVYVVYLVVGEPNPDYDSLSTDYKDALDHVWVRFADLFDSPHGGPHLQTYYQTHWSRGRMAQLMRIAMGRLNTLAQPFTTYSIDPGQGDTFPLAQWGALLETLTLIEAIKHLRRSYVEQPEFQNGSVGVTRHDRRDYLDRWGQILQDEEEAAKDQLDVFKMSLMGLGRPQVLVSGGVYGRYGPTRVAGSVAARPRYWTRFYA